MTRLPSVTARALLAALKRAGFVVVRTKGSHHFLRHIGDPTRSTVIAVHPGDLPPGTLRDILKQAGISAEELAKNLVTNSDCRERCDDLVPYGITVT